MAAVAIVEPHELILEERPKNWRLAPRPESQARQGAVAGTAKRKQRKLGAGLAAPGSHRSEKPNSSMCGCIAPGKSSRAVAHSRCRPTCSPPLFPSEIRPCVVWILQWEWPNRFSGFEAGAGVTSESTPPISTTGWLSGNFKTGGILESFSV